MDPGARCGRKICLRPCGTVQRARALEWRPGERGADEVASLPSRCPSKRVSRGAGAVASRNSSGAISPGWSRRPATTSHARAHRRRGPDDVVSVDGAARLAALIQLSGLGRRIAAGAPAGRRVGQRGVMQAWPRAPVFPHRVVWHHRNSFREPVIVSWTGRQCLEIRRHENRVQVAVWQAVR